MNHLIIILGLELLELEIREHPMKEIQIFFVVKGKFVSLLYFFNVFSISFSLDKVFNDCPI